MAVAAEKKKRTPSTRQILRQSIKDIQDGLWMCNGLVEKNHDGKNVKPMGCALGLVGINSGAIPMRHERIDGACWVFPLLRETPSQNQIERDWPRQAVEAVRLLARTTRLSRKQRENTNGDVDIVVEYNDGGRTKKNDYNISLTPAMAERWFVRALKKLDKEQGKA